MRKIQTKIALATLLLLPLVTFAAPLSGLASLLRDIMDLINLSRPIVTGLAFIYFFWGLGQFILKDAGNDKTREEGKKKMLWGIIALFVLFSIMGIIGIINGTLLGSSSSSSSSGLPTLSNPQSVPIGELLKNTPSVSGEVTIPDSGCDPTSVAYDPNC